MFLFMLKTCKKALLYKNSFFRVNIFQHNKKRENYFLSFYNIACNYIFSSSSSSSTGGSQIVRSLIGE